MWQDSHRPRNREARDRLAQREAPHGTPLLYLIPQPTGRRPFGLRCRFDSKPHKVTLPTGLALRHAARARNTSPEKATSCAFGNRSSGVHRATSAGGRNVSMPKAASPARLAAAKAVKLRA
jgi:hypothetical protein